MDEQPSTHQAELSSGMAEREGCACQGTHPGAGREGTQQAQAIDALKAKWLAQSEDYFRLFKSMRCNCSSADREVYLRVSLSLKECVRELEALLAREL